MNRYFLRHPTLFQIYCINLRNSENITFWFQCIIPDFCYLILEYVSFIFLVSLFLLFHFTSPFSQSFQSILCMRASMLAEQFLCWLGDISWFVMGCQKGAFLCRCCINRSREEVYCSLMYTGIINFIGLDNKIEYLISNQRGLIGYTHLLIKRESLQPCLRKNIGCKLLPSQVRISPFLSALSLSCEATQRSFSFA